MNRILEKLFILKNKQTTLEEQLDIVSTVARLTFFLVIILLIAVSVMGMNQHRIQHDFDDYLENQQEIEWIDSLPEDFED